MSGNNSLKIHAHVFDDTVPSVIFAVYGHIDTTSLCDIEKELNHDEHEYSPGEYIFNVYYEPDQRGEYGVIEQLAYWDLTIVSFKEVAKELTP